MQHLSVLNVSKSVFPHRYEAACTVMSVLLSTGKSFTCQAHMLNKTFIALLLAETGLDFVPMRFIKVVPWS